ncbi:MAG: hypothetical protein ACP5QP_04345 [Brevinematia bacterium]
MDFFISLIIVILVSAGIGVLFNFFVSSKYNYEVIMGYLGAAVFGVIGGILGFYYLTPVINYLVFGTNINFVAVIIGALLIVWVGLIINLINFKR